MSLTVEHVLLILGDGNQRVTVLNDVSLNVKSGSLTAVVGPSGAGKSSLLAVCGGLRTPTGGSVSIDGAVISDLTQSARARIRRDRVGFVFQQSNLVPALTAIDQLLLLVHVRGRRPCKADRQRALSLLDEVGIAHLADRRPDQLSGGEQQRVGIARALMTSPDVLLVDEPTAGLSKMLSEEVYEMLIMLTEQEGLTILLVDQEIRHALHISDYVYVLELGRNKFEGPASDFDDLEKAFWVA